MTERKGGSSSRDSKEILEARIVGPYPTWVSWECQVAERFGDNWVDGCPEAKDLVHKFYVIRRLGQKRGSIDLEAVLTFWKDAEDTVKGFETLYGGIISFIVEKTPIPVKRKN